MAFTNIKKISGPVSIALLEKDGKYITILGDYHDDLSLCKECTIEEGCYTIQYLLEHLSNTFPGKTAVFLELFQTDQTEDIKARGLLSELDLPRINSPIYKIYIRTPKVLDHFIEWLRHQDTQDMDEIYTLIGEQTLDRKFEYLPPSTLNGSRFLSYDALETLFTLDRDAPANALYNLLVNIYEENNMLYYYASVALHWIVDINLVHKIAEQNKEMSIVFIGRAHAELYEEYYTSIGYNTLIMAREDTTKCINLIRA